MHDPRSASPRLLAVSRGTAKPYGMRHKIASHIRGFIYWLLTKGPVGTFVGTIVRRRPFDRLGPVAVPNASGPGATSAIVFGLYEYPERVLIERWLPRDCDCVELGCSIGVISRIILRKLAHPRRLVAVEASRSLLKLAEKNVASAGFSTRFTPIYGAVHYGGDTVVFTEHEEHIRGKVAEAGLSAGAITPCVTLAQIIRTSALGSYSLVMDIEGSEFGLITNDLDSLRECETIIVELHGDEASRANFTEKLRSCGFTLAEAKHSVCAYVRSAQGHNQAKA